MITIYKGDIVKLKDFVCTNNEEESIFKVVNIKDSTVASDLKNPKTNTNGGLEYTLKNKKACIVLDSCLFEKYFKVKIKRDWMPWIRSSLTYKDPFSYATISCLIFYRTNGKIVQVKTNRGLKAKATCNKVDDFNLRTGLELAKQRLTFKIIENDVNYKLRKLKNNIKDYASSL